MTLKETLEKLGPALSKSIYSAWVYFKAGDLEINTGLEGERYFVSIDNRKNGSGQANSFTINIAYVPEIDSIDVNYIDRKLYGPNAKAGFSKDDIENYAVLNECILQYGYNELNISSPRYVGQLLDYSVEINNGILYYTLTGYSGIVAEKESNYNIPQYGSVDEEGKAKETEKPTVAVKKEFEKHLSKYGYNIILNSENSKDAATVIGAKSNTNVFSYASEVLASATDENAPSDQDPSEKAIYYYVVSDTENNKTIEIKRTSPAELLSTDTSIIFDWMGGFGNNTSIYSGNLVKSFMTEFKGCVPLASLSIEEENKSNIENSYSSAFNSYGEIVKANTFCGTVGSGDYANADANRLLTKWATATQYCYNATLTTVGLPCEIYIGECIRVRPLIYGREHLTAGVYMITGCQDQIDSGGFSTTLSLVKVGV